MGMELCVVASSADQASSDLDDEGTFLLSLDGREIGKEKFSIRSSSGKIEARAEIEIRVDRDGKSQDFKTFPDLVLDSDLHPVTYTWRQKGPQSSSLEMDFRNSPAKVRYRTLSGQDDQRDFALSKDVMVLDDNVIHHFEFIVNRFKRAGGGKQTLQVFVPQEALPGTLTVESTGAEAVQVHGHSENLLHIVVTTELAQINLWLDDHGRIQRVSVPLAHLEAMRAE